MVRYVFISKTSRLLYSGTGAVRRVLVSTLRIDVPACKLQFALALSAYALINLKANARAAALTYQVATVGVDDGPSLAVGWAVGLR